MHKPEEGEKNIFILTKLILENKANMNVGAYEWRNVQIL